MISAKPAVAFPAEGCHRPPAGTKLYCLVTRHVCEQLAQGCYLEADQPKFEPATFWVSNTLPLRHTGHDLGTGDAKRTHSETDLLLAAPD